MPLFYLHTFNSDGFVEDDEGQDLPDIAAARACAILSARDIMASDVRTGELDLSSHIEVEDENRRALFTVLFLDAVTLRGMQAPSSSGGSAGQSRH